MSIPPFNDDVDGETFGRGDVSRSIAVITVLNVTTSSGENSPGTAQWFPKSHQTYGGKPKLGVPQPCYQWEYNGYSWEYSGE